MTVRQLMFRDETFKPRETTVVPLDVRDRFWPPVEEPSAGSRADESYGNFFRRATGTMVRQVFRPLKRS